MREWKWSPAEKAAARRAFDTALSRELDAVVLDAKKRVASVTEASQLWELERWLSERRRDIDETFDFRYSVLPFVFAGLVRKGRLTGEDLHGLHLEKLEAIRLMVRI